MLCIRCIIANLYLLLSNPRSAKIILKKYVRKPFLHKTSNTVSLSLQCLRPVSSKFARQPSHSTLNEDNFSMDNPLTYEIQRIRKEKEKKELPPDFWYCLCHTHVHKGSFICGIVGIVVTVLYFLYVCWDTDSWEMTALALPSVLAYFLLMLGQRYEKHGLYWPHLIINSLYLLGYLTFIVLLGLQINEAYGTVFPPDMPPEQVAYFKRIGRIFYIKHTIAIAVTTILMVITCYLLKVAYRGFRYIAEIIKPSKELPPEIRAQVRDFARRQEEALDAPSPTSLSISVGGSVDAPNSTSTPMASPQSRHNSHSSPAVYKV